MYKMKRK